MGDSANDKDKKIRDVKEKIISKQYKTKKFDQKLSKKVKSHVWETLEYVYDEQNVVLKDFYFCPDCKAVFYTNIAKSGTNSLRRHSCVSKKPDPSQPLISGFSERNASDISPTDKKKIKQAACNFVVQDVRPMNIVHGLGLANLIAVFISIAQRYGKLKSEDILRLLPHQTTVNSIISFHTLI